jgi:hypothetical protein
LKVEAEMSHLPKFVRERMKASVPLAGHPDPDMLTAFSERALPVRERDVVMDHLARCGDCREIVILALPATEAVAGPVSSAHRDWFRWPVLRWGAVAAGILVMASIGIQHYRERPEKLAASVVRNQTAQNGAVPDQVARNEAPNAEMRAAPPEVQPALPSRKEAIADDQAPAPSSEAKTNKSAALSRPYRFGRTVGGPLANGVIAGAAGAGQLSNNQQANQLALNAPRTDTFTAAAKSAPSPQTPTESAPKPGVPSVSETVEVPAVVVQDQSQPEQANAGQLYAENDKALSKAKPATNQVEANSAPASAAAPSAQPVLTAGNVVPQPAPAWNITSSGGLQRSFDNGKTWHDVAVAASRGTISGFVKDEEVVALYDKVSREKKDAKAAKQQLNVAPVFRAVTANGAEVWAGGSAGTLYHSADAGDHWSRIVPSAAGVALSADIASIEFSDPQHGKVVTSDAEIWTTADRGQTWRKQ